MNIGCLFGTFDPPHKGHVGIAEHMLRSQELDSVWMVVTPQNPFKQDKSLSPDQQRLAMVRLAVKGRPGLEASGFELDLPKPNYTADSLRFMRHRWPDHRFDLIIGSDNLAIFHKWKDAEDILNIIAYSFIHELVFSSILRPPSSADIRGFASLPMRPCFPTHQPRCALS
ncbi:MAG: nicotinate-nicotinamide nucleotide adenylyltransferase [Flavobacteriales bacterium]|nr:nicotinate-nicotinamide nucleotide adenylyltransferase [Flavobacteriales bacterium]